MLKAVVSTVPCLFDGQDDPDLAEIIENFAFDEVPNEPGANELDDKTRYLAILATLLGSQSLTEFRGIVPATMIAGLTPVENQGSDVSGCGISGHRPHLSVHRRTERSAARAGSKAATALAVHLFLAAQGGCEPQLTSHAHANMRIGNDRHFLITVASQCMPYIGYPRTLNALRCVDEAANSM